MPTYEYRCANGHDFERFYRKMSDATSELPCPECGATATRQMSGGAGLLFKGSGFYLTDYGKNAHRKAEPSKSGESKSEKSEKSEKTDKGGGEAKAGEAKPAESKSSEKSSDRSSDSKSGASSTAGGSKPSPGAKSDN